MLGHHGKENEKRKIFFNTSKKLFPLFGGLKRGCEENSSGFCRFFWMEECPAFSEVLNFFFFSEKLRRETERSQKK